jgi:carbamate kinase
MILTDVPGAAVNYGREDMRWLGRVTAEELEAYELDGHFRAGSMGPKVKAAVRFVKNGGSRAVIARLDEALEALEGKTGTQVVM